MSRRPVLAALAVLALTVGLAPEAAATTAHHPAAEIFATNNTATITDPNDPRLRTRLVAFGLDSLVEVFASVVVLWYLGGEDGTDRARRALRLISVAFGLLGLYLLSQTVRGFVSLATTSWMDDAPTALPPPFSTMLFTASGLRS